MCQWTVGLLDWWLVDWWVGGGFALLGSGIVGSLDWWGGLGVTHVGMGPVYTLALSQSRCLI